MARKKRQVELTRALNLVVFRVGNVMKSITIQTKLIRTKKLKRFLRKPSNTFKLMRRHYNNTHTLLNSHQFEVSPSTTPLFAWSKRSPFKKKLLSCLLCDRVGGGKESSEASSEEEEMMMASSVGEEEEEEENVDVRAEKFIERFYEEIRLQESVVRSSATIPY